MTETLDRMDTLIHNARQNNHTPDHFRATTDFKNQWDQDRREHIGTAAAVNRESYRGVPVRVDETVNGVALVVEEEPFRVEA